MPVITKIVEQKRRPNRRNVYLDHVFAFGCNLNVIARFRLREGMTIRVEQVQEIQQGEVRQECFDKAMEYLTQRLHSRSELAGKLTRREYGDATVASVLDQLTELGYINDNRFAHTRAMSAATHKQHGPRRAKMELAKAGIRGAVAERALADVYTTVDSLSIARELAQKEVARLNRLPPLVARRRLIGMLQRRGFDFEVIKTVVDEVLGGDDGPVRD